MNWDTVEGNWQQFKGKIKQQWSKLTDDDLDLIEGKQDQLIGRIQERYGIERDRAKRDLDDWMHRN
ncbi:MAG: CsbD family protein [Alphaproteobacteria bacterium]